MIERNISEQMKLFEFQEIIRPDLNIAKWSGFLFSSPWAKDLYEEKKFTFSMGNGTNASITIVPALKRKRPTTTTLKYFYGLLEMWEEQGKRADGKVFFSGRQLAQKTDTPWAGSSTGKRIRDHLSVLTSSTIDWKRSFYNGEKLEIRVDEMHLLDSVSYIGREDMMGSEFFHVQHSARINQDLVFNMINGKTKPLNYKAFISIKNDTAIKLYNLLDNFLSKKVKWERRSYALLTEDLELTAKRYDELKIRKQRLTEIIEHLDGKEISSGVLKLFIKKTVDNEDYKLVAEKKPKVSKEKKLLKQVNNKNEVYFIVDKVIQGLESIGFVSKESSGKALANLARFYTEDLLMYVVALVKADYHGKIKDSVIKTYMYKVHLVAHERGLNWIKDCGSDCRYRPENNNSKLFLPSSSTTSRQENKQEIKDNSSQKTEEKAQKAIEAEAGHSRRQKLQEAKEQAKKSAVDSFLSGYDEVGMKELLAEFEESEIFMEHVSSSPFNSNLYASVSAKDPIMRRFFHRFIFDVYLSE